MTRGAIYRFSIAAFSLWAIAANVPAILDAASSPSGSAPPVIKDILYPGAAKGDRRRSFDLYLPAKLNGKPPLLIFVHGGFWLLSDDNYRIGSSIAENLRQDGVAVVLARYRLAPANRHPAQAQDVAAAVAALAKSADKYGYDPKRIYLAGHSAGGHLASLVALERNYLTRHGLRAESLAGVISMSGLYDLTPTWNVSENQRSAVEKTFGNDPAILKEASPIHHVRAAAPPFLLLNASSDFTGFALDARRFADALRAAGNKNVDQITVKDADHFTIVKLDDANHPVRRSVVSFMRAKGGER